MTFDKIGNISNEKKHWFAQKTRLVFMHGNVFKDKSRNSVTFKMDLLGLTTNGQQYLHVAVVTGPSLQAKLKLDENEHALNAASNMISYFVDMFFHFFENVNYPHKKINRV